MPSVKRFSFFYKIFLLVNLLVCAVFAGAVSAKNFDYGFVPVFQAQDQNGRSFTLQQMHGRVWVVNFVFTRCQGPCPILSRQMAQLQKKLPDSVGLLTFTVDPSYDSPSVLSDYAVRLKAQPDRWYFLTGQADSVQKFLIPAFRLPVGLNPQSQGAGDAFFHTLRFLLVDADGRILTHYESTDAQEMAQLIKDANALGRIRQHPLAARLVHVNAILNMLATLLLLTGLVLIKQSRRRAHQIVMSLAFAVSVLFLVCYLIYHHFLGSVAFQGQGIVRPIYFTILISHTVLAALVPLLALRTLFLAWRQRLPEHRLWARWTFPLWLYVSLTGVVVYWMLYWM